MEKRDFLIILTISTLFLIGSYLLINVNSVSAYTLQTPLGNITTIEDIADYISKFYNFLIGFAAILAVVMIMVGGVLWMMAGGSPERVSNAKSFITSALIGLILALSSYLLLQTINPRLVKLEMPELPSIKKAPLVDTPVTAAERECRDSGGKVINVNNAEEILSGCSSACGGSFVSYSVISSSTLNDSRTICCKCSEYNCQTINDSQICSSFGLPTPCKVVVEGGNIIGPCPEQ